MNNNNSNNNQQQQRQQRQQQQRQQQQQEQEQEQQQEQQQQTQTTTNTHVQISRNLAVNTSLSTLLSGRHNSMHCKLHSDSFDIVPILRMDNTCLCCHFHFSMLLLTSRLHVYCFSHR